MLHSWLHAWKARFEAVRETRTYGTLLLLFGFGIPVLFGIALVVVMVTFSWTISAEFAWTWGLVAMVVLLICVGAVVAVADRRRPYARATRKVMQRAMSGDRAAMANLARCYSRGSAGLMRDPAQAAWWWRRLAETGDPEGAYQWGRILLLGEGVMRDSAKGRSWIRAAAEAGHPQALSEEAVEAEGKETLPGPRGEAGSD
jgi:cbb3-type cytochrome oxidase subunit 3